MILVLEVALAVASAMVIAATALSEYPIVVDLAIITNQVCLPHKNVKKFCANFFQMCMFFHTGEGDDICLSGIFNETVYITVINDSFVEGNEVLYIQLILNTDNNQVEFVNDTITLVIYDDDGKLLMIKYPINGSMFVLEHWD